MPFFLIRTNELVAKLFGRRVCFFPLCPSTGKELGGPVLQGSWTTCCCCCNDTWRSRKRPSWFQRSLKTVIDACAIIKTLHQVHSAWRAQEPDCGEDKSNATNREGEKNTSTYLSIYSQAYILLFIMRLSELQISPKVQKYRLYCNEKTQSCFQCHATSAIVWDMTQCQIQLPCIGVAQWRCLGKTLRSITKSGILWAVGFNLGVQQGLCSQRITNRLRGSYTQTTQALIHRKALWGILTTFPPSPFTRCPQFFVLCFSIHR